jgi:hypothetical protein
MDSLIVNVDVANKRGVFTSSNAIGSYDTVALQAYNLPANVDLASLAAVIYTDDGTAISTCSIFVLDPVIDGLYNATIHLDTDKSIAYLTSKSPYFQQNLTFILSDANQLYCNSKLTVKNNPNAVPTTPIPVAVNFVFRNDSGWTVDLQGETPITIYNDEMTAGQVRVGLLSLAQYLKTRGIL